MIFRRDFPRRIDALADVVAFTEVALTDAALVDEQQHTVHFAIEELLTNMVKYAAQGSPVITVEIVCCEGTVDVTLIDSAVDAFDPTQVPDSGVDLPIAERRPGGLGLHLVNRLVDELRYRYDAVRREGTTTFRVGPPKAARC